ncbi:MAG: D-amino acid aminotransferase [Gammaproteobacteria bacterium]|nr:D-amino acid aminotransferase [Gammaproteobacteria bacterium]NNJ96698.1 D-amino acid aminotransferase [Gammaproteobacteria bacterium]
MPHSSTPESAAAVEPEPIVYLNGEYLAQSQARVSVLDRGFLFGDGVYEVIPVYGGKPLRLNEHLNRLQRSMGRVSMSDPLSREDWKAVFQDLLDRNPGADRSIYLQVTRGAAPLRDLSIDDDIQPTVFIMVNAIKLIDYAKIEAGIEAITVEDFRWKACDIKSVSLIANVMVRLLANQSSAVDAIMVRDGLVTEATASNVFVVHKGVIATPPNSEHLLPGITRDLVIELAQSNGFELIERDIQASELVTADEIWLTSSTREIAPVVKLDQRPVGGGVAGDSWKKMITLYKEYKQALRNG